MARSPRMAASTRSDSEIRCRTSAAYLEVAELVLGEPIREEFLSVAAGLAVLAGIAASDAICGIRLGSRYRGDNHRDAAGVLETATRDGADLANALSRLVDLKDEAHYGVVIVSATKARAALRLARKLVERANEEIER
jgi:hypothetical protein